MTHRFSITRRTFLRGAGVAIALPWMEAMQPVVRGLASAAEAGAAAGTPPVRLACLFFPNGVFRKNWIPEKTGTDFELPSSLEPLKDLRDAFTVFSNLDKKHSHGGDGHYAKTANFLTGLEVTKTTGKDISTGGQSLDQYIAQELAGKTPLPSLELGIDPVISGIDSNVGYTRLYGSHISWQTATRPVAKEIKPQAVFERLAGLNKAAQSSDARLQAEQQSLLDLAMDDAKSLRKKLGRDDQFKLDEYLDSLRAVEKRIQFFSKPDPRTWKPNTPAEELTAVGAPRDYQEHVKLMLDLQVLAFQTDATRVTSFMFANDVSGRNFSFVEGVNGSHHEFSHHENKQDKIVPYSRINRWHVAQFAYMLDRMKQVREGEKTLLDNSLVLFGCGMSDGNEHNPNNLPILVGGRGGGWHAGRHIASDKGTPLCNLYVSLLAAMGTPVERFGDSTGAIKGVLG